MLGIIKTRTRQSCTRQTHLRQVDYNYVKKKGKKGGRGVYDESRSELLAENDVTNC